LPAILILLGTSAPSFAQISTLFTVDRDLPSSMVNDIIQDSDSYIWIATENGLAKFDGERFHTYLHNPSYESSLLNNNVRVLYESQDGRLFVGTQTGAQILNKNKGKFSNLNAAHRSGAIQPVHVTCFLETSNGDILVGTSGNGVFKLSKDDETGNDAIKENLPHHPFFINFLHEDDSQNIWIGSSDKGIIKVSQGLSNTYLEEYLNRNLYFAKSTYSFYVGVDKIGVFVYNKADDNFVLLPGTESLNLSSLFVRSDGHLLIGTENKGVWNYNPTANKLYREEYGVMEFDLTKAKIHSITEDSNGNIWLGVYQKGVVLAPTSSNGFSYIGYRSWTRNIIGQNCVMSILYDSDGNLWSGMDSDGIYKISESPLSSKHIALNDGNNPATVMCIYEDKSGTIWAGAYETEGLYKINKHSGQYTRVFIKTDDDSSAKSIYDIKEDDSGNMWIATMGGGLFSYNPATGSSTHYASDDNYDEQSNSLNNDWINCLLICNGDKLLIGTFDGISCLDLSTNNFHTTFGCKRILPYRIIYDIKQGDDGTIWAGTSDGLFTINLNTAEAKLISFSEESQAKDKTVLGICQSSNYLWLSTLYGISQFNPQNGYVNHYRASDGLQGNEFSKRAATQDQNGRICFGGVNGLSCFDPKKINTPSRSNLSVVITSFLVEGVPISEGMKSGKHVITKAPVNKSKLFHLAHHDNYFTIGFSDMEFNKTMDIDHLYSLDGQNWIMLGPGERNVSFSNLRPGLHTFSIKSRYFSEESQPTAIEVKIYPPWYLTFWAILLYSLILIGAVIALYQSSVKRQREKTQKLEDEHIKAMNETRLQMFTNISHEIRTPMSVIINILDKLIEGGDDEAHNRMYSSIYRNAERILDSANQMMDIQKLDSGKMQVKFKETDFIPFTSRLIQYFSYSLSQKKISLNTQYWVNELKAYIDPQNFDKIFNNIISNAIKFTPEGGHIEIQLDKVNEEGKDYAKLCIEDNGPGINPENLEHIFERFWQESPRSGGGTGIGLHLVKRLVDIHSGKVWAENKADGKGCRFVVLIPMGKDHIPQELIDTAEAVPIIHKRLQGAKEQNQVDVINPAGKETVVIIDDDDEIRSFLQTELENKWKVVSFGDSKKALEYITREIPDLVLSDVMMPVMDGISLCKKLKNNINTNKIPIILLTAKVGEENNIEGLSAGADAYITKPFSIKVVSENISNLLKSRQTLRNAFQGMQEQSDKIDKDNIASPDERLLARVMESINKNISNSEYKVEDLAADVGISRVHLHRKLKELTNQTSRDFLRNIRLQKAAMLLKDKKQSIAEVAYSVGFQNLAHFSTAFKEMYGMPPSEYREKPSDVGPTSAAP